MSRNMELALTLMMRDRMSPQMNRAIDNTTKRLAAAHNTVNRMTRAREALSIRSEREIQREIDRSVAAYNRLARSGTMSYQEQARAASAMRDRVRELNQEMGRTTRLQRMGGIARAGGQVLAGVAAAKYVMQEPIRKTMDYDLRLAHLSNKAFSDRDTAGRKAGQAEIGAGVMNAVRFGGGSRDDAMETLSTLVESGALTLKESQAMLPKLMRVATASGASASELANIAIRASQSFGIKDVGKVLDMAVAAGKAGGFELKDMAKWLPQQMAAAGTSGLHGEAGFSKLLAMNQASVITAGTKDEAGNNLVNLLAKINSHDTANDAKRLGIDLPGALASARSKGVDSIDAFYNLLEQQAQKDKQYQALKAKMKNAKGAEQTETLQSMASILEGKALGSLIQDRQALMALLAVKNNHAYMKKIEASLPSAGGTAEADFNLISSTASYKTNLAKQEKENAMQNSMDRLNPLLGMAADHYTTMAQKYPTLVSATTAATVGLTALAAAAGAASLAGLLGKGGVLSGGLSRFGVSLGGAALGLTRLLGPIGVIIGAVTLLDKLMQWRDSSQGNSKNTFAEITNGKYQAPSVTGTPQKYLDILAERHLAPGSSGWQNALMQLQMEDFRKKQSAEQATNKTEINLVVDGAVLAKVVNDVNRTQAKRN